MILIIELEEYIAVADKARKRRLEVIDIQIGW